MFCSLTRISIFQKLFQFSSNRTTNGPHMIKRPYRIELSLYSTATQNLLGPGVGSDPKHHNFVLVIPTCWYLKTLKFALPPTQNPHTSQWNIGCVWSPTQHFCIGHVDFMLFIPFLVALRTQRERCSQCNMGFRIICLVMYLHLC